MKCKMMLQSKKNGIYRYCRDGIEKSLSDLSRVIPNCDFDIPSNFVYKDYLENLGSNINNLYKELNKINSKLKEINAEYVQLEDDLIDSVKSLETVKIKERDRMVI